MTGIQTYSIKPGNKVVWKDIILHIKDIYYHIEDEDEVIEIQDFDGNIIHCHAEDLSFTENSKN